ncbi:hypothetical protein SAMN05216262_10457 [Colwellia chukchiensis]|uniref:YcxB-like C-terminal domain-containing protein n=1 Tax=Colwellia chukchiensis TaxID=641665 RepID=A0A1H7L5Y9_9GAMM|nr:YcxB family protein [Colwellia chukchiensis]SEK94421.1 hypothetical protein SAMN05216262_10457 [Colwellia chukchiensis]
MNQPFNYQTSFILDKSHFIECYEESVPVLPWQRRYAKGAILLLLGALLVLFTELNPYAAWFIFSLGVLELVSSYYQKPWWVARQMLSKVAKAEVKLSINQDGLHIHSFYHDHQMRFADIERIDATKRGWLIYHNSVKHYVANRCLSAQAQAFLQSQANG